MNFQLWLPDVAIYNNADGDFIISEMVRAKVYYNGTITWRPPIISKTFCEIRVADFPFGKCSISNFSRNSIAMSQKLSAL